MKRIHMCKKVNRSNNLFNNLNRKPSHLNTVTPEILVGQIWLQEDEPAAVEIIELNTSEEYDPKPNEEQNNNLDHAWSYINNDRLQQIEDNYKINKKARERWRKNHENHVQSINTATNTNNSIINQLYSDMAEKHMEESELNNHQVNCFTIINKHFVDSDTSSDREFADVEILTSNDIIMEPHPNWDTQNNSYDEEYITDLDNETRTIWIYSFKNKHLLTENDYEFANLATRDASSSSTSDFIESDEERTKDKCTNVRRIGSPIPPAYIPRLNLSLAPTLSTVTEVSEPIKQASSNGSNKSSTFQKPKNSWFVNENEKMDSGRSISKREKSTNIVNWMALSPREKRRRSKGQEDKWEGTVLKLDTPRTQDESANSEQQTDETKQDKALILQVDVDVHVSVNDKSIEKRSLGTPNSADVKLKTNKDDKNSLNTINYLDALVECVKDRGDSDIKFENNQQVLCHTLDYQSIPSCLHLPHHHHHLYEENREFLIMNQHFDHVDDIKPRSSAEWRQDGLDEIVTANYDYVTGKMEVPTESSSNKVWAKNNMPLLKPSEWNEYMPVAESHSLHLSLGSMIEQPQPWYKRFIKYVNCCK